jgi:hypothetical protein
MSKYYVLQAACRLFLLGLFFDPEDGINTFLRNVVRSPNSRLYNPCAPYSSTHAKPVESLSDSDTLLPSVDSCL